MPGHSPSKTGHDDEIVTWPLPSPRSRRKPCPTCPRSPALTLSAGVGRRPAPAGIRHAGRTDVLLVLLDEGTAAAGVFTRSKCPSAPVEWCRDKLKGRNARALVVNSGNANAFTGKSGRAACKFTAELAAKAAG